MHINRRYSLLAATALVTACAFEEAEPIPSAARGEDIGAAAVAPETHGPGFDDATARAVALDVELQPGVPVTGLAGARAAELRYHLVVPDGAQNLQLRVAGGTGDADLYVRFGQPPTTRLYDYRPYLSGNDESVRPSPVRAGTYHLMVRGYAAFDGATLTASYDPPVPADGGVPPIDAGDDGGGGLDCRNEAAWPADWVVFEDRVLALINARRAAGATCGSTARPAVGAVVMNADLREAARCHSLDMAVQGYFDHTSPDGRSPWDRIAEAGYTASPTGENIAAGYATPEQVVDGWMASEGHCNNIMSGGSNETGVGYALRDGSPYGRYWTQTFGRR